LYNRREYAQLKLALTKNIQEKLEAIITNSKLNINARISNIADLERDTDCLKKHMMSELHNLYSKNYKKLEEEESKFCDDLILLID
jgi:hypothetical protein